MALVEMPRETAFWKLVRCLSSSYVAIAMHIVLPFTAVPNLTSWDLVMMHLKPAIRCLSLNTLLSSLY